MQVFVKPGDTVTKGSTVMTVDAMKVEVYMSIIVHVIWFVTSGIVPQMDIIAIRDGQIKDVYYQAGDDVPEFATVIEYEADDVNKDDA